MRLFQFAEHGNQVLQTEEVSAIGTIVRSRVAKAAVCGMREVDHAHVHRVLAMRSIVARQTALALFRGRRARLLLLLLGWCERVLWRW